MDPNASFPKRRRTDGVGLSLPPLRSPVEPPEIDDRQGRPTEIDNYDVSPATHTHPQQGLKRSRDEAFGADPDTPDRDPTCQVSSPTSGDRALLLQESGLAPLPRDHLVSLQSDAVPSNHFLTSFQEPGVAVLISPGGQNGTKSNIEPEDGAVVPSKGTSPAPRDNPDTVIMPWIEFSTTVEGEVGRYRQRSATATAYGGFSDIFQCDARFPDGSCTLVAVKRLRAVKMCKSLDTYQIDRKLQKRLNREVRIWAALQHPNIVPLLGFGLSGEVCVISSWFTNGNIGAHLEANPNADRMKLIRQVAAGVAYLHGRNPVVVHGDLKPDNVLIDDDGVAKLIDFGLSKAVEAEQGASALSSTSLRDVGNARWIAPELLLDEEASRSCSTDTFSFGCVAFYIFTGDVPFRSNSDRTLYLSRYNGAQPMRSEADYPGLQRTELINVLRSCWEVNPDQRPMMSEVVAQCLEEPPPLLQSLQFKGQGMLLKLQQIALRRDIDPIVRQQAIVQAKNNTQLQWKSRTNTSQEDLVQLRQNVFLFIDEPDEVVARNNQMMLAKASRIDFPNRWPDLLDTIMGHIQVNVQARLASPSPDEGVLLRSRRSLGLLNAVLKEFVSMRSPIGTQICAKASAKVCPFLAPLVEQLTTLLNTSLTPATINQPSTVYDVEMTRLSWKCWSKMMLWAWGRWKKLSPEEMQAFQDFFTSSFTTVQRMWNYRMDAIQVAGSSPDAITDKCLKPLTKLIYGLGKSFRTMQKVAGDRFVLLPSSTDLVVWYWSKVAETPQANEDQIVESLLVPYPLPLVIQGMAIFKDSLSQWCLRKEEGATDAERHVEALSQAMVTNAVSLLITRYIPLKPSDLERWESDPEGFLNAEDKENDQWEFFIRPCAERVLMALALQYPDYVTPLLQQLFQSIITSSATDLNSIVRREAVYCALGRCAGPMKGAINLDEWLPILEAEARNPNFDHRPLKRRIAWLLGKWHHDDSRPLVLHVKVWEVLFIVLTDRSAWSDSTVRLTAVIALRDCVENENFDIESFHPFFGRFLANLYPVISESETVESKRRVFKTMNSIVGAVGPRIVPFLQPTAALLANLWTKADTEYSLKQDILIFVRDLVEASREQSVILHPLVVMLVQQRLSPGAQAQLDIDSLGLWKAAIRNCPSLQPNQPGLLDLLPPLVEILGSDMNDQSDSNLLLESYYLIDCPLFLQRYSQQLFSAYATAHQQALAISIKDLTESLELLIQLSGSAISWAEAMHSSGLIGSLLRYALASKGSVSVVCDHFYLFSRMVLQDPDVFVQLVASAAPALSQTPEQVFNNLMDVWWRNFDSMAESRHRKMTAMSMANLTTTGQPQVMERLATEISNIWLDVLGEIKEAEADDPENPPLHTYWNDGSEPPHYWIRGTENTLEEERRRTLWIKDPVQTIKLTKYIAEKLKITEARMGKMTFDQAFTEKVDPAVLKQVQEALAS